MGLDMFLFRMPRYKDTTARQIRAIEENISWQDAIASGKCKRSMSMKEWSGYSQDDLPSEDAFWHYVPLCVVRYAEWDTEKKYPHKEIMEEVAYWRKANQIHNWFVDHIQSGIDDCNFHDEVTEEILLELLADCKLVLQKVRYLEDGEIIVPKSVENILPTCTGFFFGSYEYDHDYIEDIKDTVKIIREILEETDFETQMFYYVSSW